MTAAVRNFTGFRPVAGTASRLRPATVIAPSPIGHRTERKSHSTCAAAEDLKLRLSILAAAARVSFQLGKIPFGALTRATLYLLKAATFICSIPLAVAKKILDGLGKITEPSWSR